MKKIVLVVLALLLVGCSGRMKDEEVTGTALGAVIGAIIGYQFGGGAGTWLTTAAGAAVGGTAGYYTGRKLAESDRTAYRTTAIEALARTADGRTESWSNAETGRTGTFTPVRSYRAGDGRLCRDYHATIAFDDGTTEGTGKACQTAEGHWRQEKPTGG